MSNWIQVVGVFDSQANTGEILGVQPALAPKSATGEASEITLTALSGAGEVLAEVPVTPDYGSCDDNAEVGTFQIYIDLPSATRALSLQHQGVHLAQFVPDDPAASAAGESFGLSPQADHRVRLEGTSGSPSNATYILQARPKGTTIWETLDIGLDRPETATVDLRQFPDAEVVEVRILKSSGFETVELDRQTFDFNE